MSSSTNEIPLESNLIVESGEMVGRVTSIAFSPTLEKTIGLADVFMAYSEVGTVIHIKLTNGRLLQAKVVKTPFYDPEGAKQVQALDENGGEA
ncbi:MAG: glycine cleavage T C-terminal barrel domain-containing protein, partial [Thiomicrorhabdus sp.]|nr:glycine cleavage T C-terminal barrel domain-containing protein [Thiomicrorhabdus sp.]